MDPREEGNKEEGRMNWTKLFKVQKELKPCGKFSSESQGTKLLFYFSVNKLIEIIKRNKMGRKNTYRCKLQKLNYKKTTEKEGKHLL